MSFVQLHVWVKPETREFIQRLARSEQWKQGAVIDQAVKALANQMALAEEKST